MEIVQTGTSTWRRCVNMFGVRFAVFVRRARVLLGPCPATRNLSFLRFHRRRHPVVSTRNFHLEMARVGVKIPQDGNRANVNGHVAVVHEHVWRTLCSVCATGARVAQPVPCKPWCMGMFGARFAVFVRRARVLPSPCRNLSFLRFHCCFNSLFHWKWYGLV